MTIEQPSEFASAVRDFRDARRRAALQDILAHILGKPENLLSFDETRKLHNGQAAVYLGLQEIPMDSIVGSVGRYRDFTRTFLPRRDTDESRWARVKSAIPKTGFNPIEVYRVGDAYFVLDGNHRVSIARARGDRTIQAYVTEIPTLVPLAPTDNLDDVIRKAEQADFLEQTGLSESRPGTDFTTSAPGSFIVLNQRIARQQRQHPGLAWPELAVRWHDEDFLPFVRMVQEKGLQRDFPGRTETDLYAWILRRQEELQQKLGWHVPFRVAAAHLIEKASPRPRRIASRLGSRLSDLATPDPLEPGPRPGAWRQWALATHREDHLFTDYLVPISGNPQGWQTLDQALRLARLEQDFIHGLHVIPAGALPEDAPRADLRAEFDRRLAEAGVQGELTVEAGSIARTVCAYAAWVDLVILDNVHPPGGSPLRKAASGLHTIIHRSPRPLILVPGPSTPFERLLLAYDGSPKANEALYVAAYLAGKWKMALHVLTVAGGKTAADMLDAARAYLLERRIAASYHLERGDPAEKILAMTEETGSDTILMGGYGHRPILELMLGSAVDRVLQETRVPVFLCR